MYMYTPSHDVRVLSAQFYLLTSLLGHAYIYTCSRGLSNSMATCLGHLLGWFETCSRGLSNSMATCLGYLLGRLKLVAGDCPTPWLHA